MSEKKRRLWPWILLSVLLTIMLGAAWCGYSVYRYWTVTIPNALAQQGAAELVMIYMKLHDGAWPKSWDDLEPIHAKYNTHWNSDFKRLQELVEIDWTADPVVLTKAKDGVNEPPFRVIWRRDGRKSHFDRGEPNQMILDYFNGVVWIDPVPRVDARP
jgi:hypothetical protein